MSDARIRVRRETSAGGLVYRRRAGTCVVLLGGRRRPPLGRLTWGLPKGHVERGETLAEAAHREVREETGAETAIEGTLGDVRYAFLERRGDRIVRIQKRVRYFLMRWTSGRIADRDDELDAVRWVPLAEATRVVGFANERALVRRAFARLAAADAPPRRRARR